jgi:AcrR family transcriptional regulator
VTVRDDKAPRTKPSAERRADLMDAALRLFLDQGVTPTTIEQITVRAQVAKGTFYLHFSSKDDVLVALRERFVRGLLETIDIAVCKLPAHDWRGRLEAWAKASIDGFLDSVRLHDIVFHEFEPHSQEEHADNVLVAHLGALLEAGTAASAWRVEDPRFTAVFLFHGYHGIVDDARVLEKRINRARLARRLVGSFFRAVGLDAD